MVTPETISEALRDVMDPEIHMNVVDLGLIKEIAVGDDTVSVKMVLTFPGCPLAGYLVAQVRSKVEQVAEGRRANVELLDEAWTPPWTEKPERA